MGKFKSVDCEQIDFNVFKSIGKEWMLITSGNENGFNTMTASWGGMGVLLNKNVAFALVRPQRYTFEFTEKNDFFTLCFFDENYKKDLLYLGTHSGRNEDKLAHTHLSAAFNFNAPYFEQAKLVLVCKKIYAQYLDKDCVIAKEIESQYEKNDYHQMYVGEILKAYVKDE